MKVKSVIMIFVAALQRIFWLLIKEARYDPDHLKQWMPLEVNETFNDHRFLHIATKYVWVGTTR
jgi:hypothetical protein